MTEPADGPMEDLDARVRDVDPDRWLASRFVAEPDVRADLIALYAFEHELNRIAGTVREPLMAEIRLTWWREAVDGLMAGAPPRAHPVLQALAGVFARRELRSGAVEALIDAHFALLDREPEAGVTRETALMSLATAVLGADGQDAAVADAGRAYALRADPVQRRAAIRASRSSLRSLPSAAFPAVAYAGLRPSEGDLTRRLRVTWAVLTGQI